MALTNCLQYSGHSCFLYIISNPHHNSGEYYPNYTDGAPEIPKDYLYLAKFP